MWRSHGNDAPALDPLYALLPNNPCDGEQGAHNSQKQYAISVLQVGAHRFSKERLIADFAAGSIRLSLVVAAAAALADS